jgi:hypothetical protein
LFLAHISAFSTLLHRHTRDGSEKKTLIKGLHQLNMAHCWYSRSVEMETQIVCTTRMYSDADYVQGNATEIDRLGTKNLTEKPMQMRLGKANASVVCM